MTDLRKKNIIYSLVLVSIVALVWWFRGGNSNHVSGRKIELSGATMGTTYQVKYITENVLNYQDQIDSILQDFNACLSTYIDDSEISRFNQGTLHRYESSFFYPILEKSHFIFESTAGAFDPTVMPLVNALSLIHI